MRVGWERRGFRHAAGGSKEEFYHEGWQRGGSIHAGGKGVRRELMELRGDLSNQAQIRERCLELNWTVTRNTELQTSASVKDIQRSHCLGTCVFLDSTTIQGNIAHVFLIHYMEVEYNVPQILKPEGKSCYERMATLKPTSAPSKGDGDLFAQPAWEQIRKWGTSACGFGL